MARKKLSRQSHQLRIIAGKWRGQKINVIEQADLRPTADRVRETVFNWLALPVVRAYCLDAFAGSGILGFEALSRNAAFVTALDNSSLACQAIKKNKAHLQADAYRLIEQDVCAYLQSTSLRFDIIFLDPPFALPNLIVDALSLIHQRALLHNDGLVYIELAKQDRYLLDGLNDEFVWLKEKIAGQVCYALLRLNQ